MKLMNETIKNKNKYEWRTLSDALRGTKDNKNRCLIPYFVILFNLSTNSEEHNSIHAKELHIDTRH